MTLVQVQVQVYCYSGVLVPGSLILYAYINKYRSSIPQYLKLTTTLKAYIIATLATHITTFTAHLDETLFTYNLQKVFSACGAVSAIQQTLNVTEMGGIRLKLCDIFQTEGSHDWLLSVMMLWPLFLQRVL